MRILPRLPNKTIIALGRFFHRLTFRQQRKSIERLTRNRSFSVWEMDYSAPAASQAFIETMRAVLPIGTSFHFFVNHTAQMCYATIGVPDAFLFQSQPILNTVIGVPQTFVVPVEQLLALAVYEVHSYAIDATAESIRKLYAPVQAASA